MSRSRRTRRDLTLEEILDVARPILRSQGEEALSMRRVAEGCGVTPMALYHHVPTKQALVTLLVGEVLLESVSAPLATSDWKQALIEQFVRVRRALVENPGAGRAFLRRPVVDETSARTAQQGFELLARGGITGLRAGEVYDGLILLLFGSVANDLTRPDEVRVKMLDVLPDELKPLHAEAFRAYSTRDPAARFRMALQWLLDGAQAEK